MIFQFSLLFSLQSFFLICFGYYNIFLYIYPMKKFVFITLFILCVYGQNFKQWSQVAPTFNQVPFIPAPPQSPERIQENIQRPQISGNVLTPEDMKKIENTIKNQQGYQYPEIELGPQELIFVATILVLCIALLVAHVTVCICCLKKRNKRNKIKRQMQELQIMFSNSQNMTIFQMQRQPNFPRTIHI